MLKLIMEELKKLNISDNQIIYINFENLKNRSLNNYEKLFLTIYILNLMINLRIIIFFLDEIQEVEEWRSVLIHRELTRNIILIYI